MEPELHRQQDRLQAGVPRITEMTAGWSTQGSQGWLQYTKLTELNAGWDTLRTSRTIEDTEITLGNAEKSLWNTEGLAASVWTHCSDALQAVR